VLTSAVEKVHKSHRGYVDLPHGQLHYRRWSAESEANPWVLLHHSASDSRSLEHLGDALAAKGLSTIAFDTPGFGMSDPLETPSIAGFAEAVTAGMKSLGLEHWSVFGHHTGASIALRVAAEARDSVDRAALSGILLPEAGDRTRLAKALGPLPIDSAGSHLMSAWERVSRYTPDAPLEVLTREAVSLLSAHSPHLVYEDVMRYDSRSDLARVSAPVLVLCGADEFLARSTPEAAALTYDGRWQIIAGAGLDVQETHPTQLADALAAFALDT
jgi:pimeloyl-ACP methyl ester carboxylesterase